MGGNALPNKVVSMHRCRWLLAFYCRSQLHLSIKMTSLPKDGKEQPLKVHSEWSSHHFVQERMPSLYGIISRPFCKKTQTQSTWCISDMLASELFCNFRKDSSICHVFCTKLNTFTLNVPPSSKQRPFMEFFSRPFASSRSTALTGSQLWWIAHLFLKIAKDGVLCTIYWAI